MHLQDEHLKTALQHSPDRDMQPSAHVRDAILQYAKKASAPELSILQCLQHWLFHEKLSQAQWAGIGTAATILLVVFMAWQRHPEDSVWITAGTDSQNAAHNEITASKPAPASQHAETATATSPESAPATASLAEDKLSNLAQSEPILTQIDQDKLDSQTQTDRLNGNVISEKLAGKNSDSKDAGAVEPLEKAAPEANQASVGESNAAIKELPAELSAQNHPSPAAVATAPQVNLPESKITLSAPKPAPQADDSRLANKNHEPLGTTTAQAKRKQDIEGTAEKEGATGKLEGRAIANDAHETLDNNYNALVEQLITQGGKKVANQDIKNDALRILNVVVHRAKVGNQQACTFNQTSSINFDSATGLRIEIIDTCAGSEQLQNEVENYNKTMKSWYLQFQGE